MNLESLMAITILLLNRKRVRVQDLAMCLKKCRFPRLPGLRPAKYSWGPIVSYTGAELYKGPWVVC